MSYIDLYIYPKYEEGLDDFCHELWVSVEKEKPMPNWFKEVIAMHFKNIMNISLASSSMWAYVEDIIEEHSLLIRKKDQFINKRIPYQSMKLKRVSEKDFTTITKMLKKLLKLKLKKFMGDQKYYTMELEDVFVFVIENSHVKNVFEAFDIKEKEWITIGEELMRSAPSSDD